MASSRYGVLLTTEEFVAAVAERPSRMGAAAFARAILGEDYRESGPALAAAVLRRRPADELLDAIQFGTPDVWRTTTLREYNFNPDEPRDERGRWTTGGGTSGPSPKPADLLLKGDGKHLIPQSQICATWTDSSGVVHTETGTTAADLRAMIGRIRAAGGTIDHLIVKGHGGSQGMTDDNNVGTFVPDPQSNTIWCDGNDIAADLRRVTNAQSQISLRGCSTTQAADDAARILGDGATVSGNWRAAVGIPGTTWDVSPWWSNYSHSRGGTR